MFSFNGIARTRSTVAPVIIAALLTSGSLFGCNDTGAGDRQPIDESSAVARGGSSPVLPLAAIAALDEGNTAYRAKQFDAAIDAYRKATAAAPDHAAPWFGLYMAANEVGNAALADSAMVRVKALSADSATLNAHVEVASPSVIPSTPSMPPNHPPSVMPTPLPSGHPSTEALPPGHPAPVPPARPVTPRKSGAAT